MSSSLIPKSLPNAFTSIKQRFMIPMIIAVVFVMSISTAFSYYSTVRDIENQVASKLEFVTNQAALNFSNPLWNYNDYGLTDTTEAIMVDHEVGFIEVYDIYGDKKVYKKLAGPPYSPNYLSQSTEIIFHQGEDIGKVTIGITSYYRYEALRASLISTLINTSAVIFILIITITIVSRYITKPILDLVSGADVFGSGDLKYRLPVHTKDEIGVLATKFNAMAESLDHLMQERDENAHELRRLNETLADQNKALTNEIQSRIKAQNDLAFSEEKFSKSFHHSAEVVGLVRIADRHFIEVNNTFYETFGYTPEEVIEHTSEEFNLWANPRDREKLYSELNAYTTLRNFESVWNTKTGTPRIGLLSVELFEIQGNPHHIFMWNDITDRKRAEEALAQAHTDLERKVQERTAQLTASNENLSAINKELVATLEQLKLTQDQLLQSKKLAALGGLVAGIAHEINTPVGISVTGITYLERELDTIRNKIEHGALKRSDMDTFLNEVYPLAQTIFRNLDRADNLIRSFKLVAADQTVDERRHFNLKEYLNELVISLTPMFKKTPHTVTIECPEDLVIYSFPGTMAQIVTNFISNSIKHGFEQDKPGHIEIKVQVENDIVIMKYIDNGKGMSSESLERVFDPFYTTQKGMPGSTGLGMNLVYNLVKENLNGMITCESLEGQGITFTIRFPLQKMSSFEESADS